ncbi:MAG: GIY-YIG nuclease family protein [Thaumarchaeota archaeon]|nr:GIY-YIG nuclease family protein [Nitrososphaerota archaeon]
MRGVYLLFLKIAEDVRMRVGGLGRLTFKKGLYVYVGSAQNNLEKRIMRHKSRVKKLRWHIDYLTKSKKVKPIAAYAYDLGREYECIIARLLSEISSESIKGFGSSDCKCRSHLFRLSGKLESVCQEVSEKIGRRPRRIF